MALEGENVRDYSLTEKQKAIKAKYPPVNRKYEYLDHTADVQLHAWGDTLEEAFEQCAMAMFGYMTDTGTVEPLQATEVETQGDDLQSLLFHFLNEWLYKFSADEFFIAREVKVLNIDQRNFKLRSIGWGEEFSLSKHPQGVIKEQAKDDTMHVEASREIQRHSPEEGQGKFFLPYSWNVAGLRAQTSPLLISFPSPHNSLMR
ncbi:protein archease isoform X2 [Lagenorhynchus albirostris]|uniref:protein archease isoform X2 n=1 Tax=Lagenorhynchus albirostris TaxID=27610 RepID=UPI0028E93A4D|nr:protein archease isoform X2 [Lagenorhynchus albirostris]